MSNETSDLIHEYYVLGYRKTVVVSIAIMIIIFNLISIYIGKIIGIIFLDLIFFLPLSIFIYLLFFKIDKPLKLYNDRLIGPIYKINLKTHKQKRINELKFVDLKKIYISDKKFDKNFYLTHKDNSQIILYISDETFSKKLKEIFKTQYNEKIIPPKKKDNTFINAYTKAAIPLAIISMIGVFLLSFLLSQNILEFYQYSMILVIIFSIVLGIISLYLYKKFPNRLKQDN
jgi:hypothetical protein